MMKQTKEHKVCPVPVHKYIELNRPKARI